jgi:hypothetical protein
VSKAAVDQSVTDDPVQLCQRVAPGFPLLAQKVNWKTSSIAIKGRAMTQTTGGNGFKGGALWSGSMPVLRD